MELKDHLKECDKLYDNEDYEGLIEKCDEVLSEFPDNQNAIGYKGISLLFLGENQKALEILERGVELYPNNYYLKNNLAMVYYELEDYETSLKLCEEGLEIRDFDWLCENKFKNLIRLDRFDEAIEFEKTVGQGMDLRQALVWEDMGEHELNYYYHLLKENPGDSYFIDMIKMISAKLNMTPEVGDYYMNWICAIESVGDKTEGRPDGEQDLSIGNDDVNISCEDSSLEDYVRFKMFLLKRVLAGNPNGVGLDELKEEIFIFDDREFDDFISHLIEIGYIAQSDDGLVKLEGVKMDEVLKKETMVDNSRLEEMLEGGISPQMEAEFIETLKKSYLYLPVSFSENMFEGLEDAEVGDTFKPQDQPGFDINYLSDADGNKAVPLFTSDSAMAEGGCRSSVMVMHASDLVDMLKQSDRYSAVAINPFTEHGITMPMEVFLNILHEPTAEEKAFIESMNEILKILKEHSYELEEKMKFIFRSDEDFMRQNAVDEVFRPNIPFYVSSNPHFCEGMKYTNILLFNEGDRVLPIGNTPKDEPDTVVAPGTEFRIVEKLDEFTTVWMCGAQPFYDD